MSLPDLTALSRHLASPSPDDEAEHLLNLERVGGLSEYVRMHGERELVTAVDAAEQLIAILATPTRFVDRARVLALTCGVLEVAESAVEHLEEQRARSSTEPAEDPSPVQSIRDMVLGKMLIELGHCTRDQVAAGLRMHRRTRMPFGECMLMSGHATPERLLETMRLQEQLRGGALDELPAAAETAATEPAPDATPAAGDRLPASPASPQAALPSEPSVPQPAPSGFLASRYLFLGELLLQQGLITNEALEQAMHRHHIEGVRVGDALLQAGALGQAELDQGLALQERLRRIAGLKCNALTGG